MAAATAFVCSCVVCGIQKRQLWLPHSKSHPSGQPERNGKLFEVAQDDKYAAAIDVHFAVAAHQNDFMTSGRHHQVIEISPEQHAARAGVTYRFKTGIQVTEGPSRIAIGVMDTNSRLAGFRNVEVIAQ